MLTQLPRRQHTAPHGFCGISNIALLAWKATGVGCTARQAVSDPMRLYTLLGRDHTTLLHAGNAAGADDVAGLEAAADAVVQAAHGQMDVYLVAAPDADVAGTVLPLIRDADGDFARNYDVSDTSVFVIRPDGYLGIAARGVVDTDELVRHLKATFR